MVMLTTMTRRVKIKTDNNQGNVDTIPVQPWTPCKAGNANQTNEDYFRINVYTILLSIELLKRLRQDLQFKTKD